MRVTSVFATAAVSVAVLAPVAVAQKDPTDRPDPQITNGTATKRLHAAQAKWKAQHISSYRIRVRLTCFCPPERTRPVTVTVRRGKLAKSTPADVRSFATVPRLFANVRHAIAGKVANLDVRYDAKRGFPATISIDRSRRIADEEGGYVADRFVRLASHR